MKRPALENLRHPCCTLCSTVRSALELEDVVTDAQTAVLTHILVSRSFGYLTRAQRRSVIEALMLTVVPPGEVPDAVRESRRRKLLTLPWAWELSVGTDDGLVDRSDTRMVRLEDPRLLGQFGRGLARDLRSTALRESVLRLMILLCYADGGRPERSGLFTLLREAMAVPERRAARIAAELADEIARVAV